LDKLLIADAMPKLRHFKEAPNAVAPPKFCQFSDTPWIEAADLLCFDGFRISWTGMLLLNFFR
jgi:hypothetical protein